MRLLSLAVVLALVAGSVFAADDKKPADPVKKDDKGTKHEGTVSKIDGKKITVKGTGSDTKDMTFTTDDHTKFYRDDKTTDKDKEVAAKDDTKKADPKGTEIKLTDIKEGDRVTVVAGTDLVATEVWVHSAKKDK